SAVQRCVEALPAASRPGLVEQKALAALAAQSPPEAFLSTLQDALVSRMAGSEDLAPWRPLLSCLQRELIAAANTPQEVAALAARFQEARMLLSELERAREGRELTELRRHLRELRGVMEGLISVASADELMDDLTPQLGRIDLRTCLIAVYSADVTHHRGESWVVPDHAELMLAVIDGTRLRGAEGFFSPARNMVPPSVPASDRPSTRVATSMYFREEQIGYLVFEPGGCDPAIYETFCILLANVLKGSRLLAARKDAEERLRQVLAELEEYNQRLSGLSQTDELTGLYNRRAFISLGSQNLALARRMGRGGTVVFADVDYLKTINDSFGHEEGDVALVQAARILAKAFRNSDLVARLGGDEFSALSVGTAAGFRRTIRRRLDEGLLEYNRQSGKSYQLSISIGSVAFESSAGMDLEELLHRADRDLYKQKKKLKGLS
ncbi:MAG TPA: GGDEF domain-containing protein, partial [Spirochaetia bacterium]|nr:GGDEF domain-containing protein [Spirochaetia bacterium]